MPPFGTNSLLPTRKPPWPRRRGPAGRAAGGGALHQSSVWAPVSHCLQGFERWPGLIETSAEPPRLITVGTKEPPTENP